MLHTFTWHLLLWAIFAQVRATGPFSVAYNKTAPVGPDGPWWVVTQTVDSPGQVINLMPRLTGTTLVIGNTACTSSGATCPPPIPGLWSETSAAENSESKGNETVPASHFTSSEILNLDGDAWYYGQSLILQSDEEDDDPLVINDQAVAVSLNLTARFPGGASYTLDTGFLSLSGDYSLLWYDQSGSSVQKDRTLVSARYQHSIASTSYGIHVGSVEPHVESSLVLGGYDRSRCISDPIVSTDMAVQLVDISLGVTSGSSSFTELPEGKVDGLMRANDSIAINLAVLPDPGLPYMYLPRDTCDAIARYLPVTYNSDFNLYLWDTDKPAFKPIVTSAHFLSFTFAADLGLRQSIKVPFSVLNLTLDKPLMYIPTAYFPCSPWAPSDSSYYLGRAFLQAAFMAQNWDQEKLFLAQAPGPKIPPRDVQEILFTDTSISPLPNPPSWESTWGFDVRSETNQSSSDDGNTENSPGSANGVGAGGHEGGGSDGGVSDQGGLDGGVIAGIVVGVVACIALVSLCIFWLARKRKQRKAVSISLSPSETGKPHLEIDDHDGNPVESGGEAIHEANAVRDPAELDATKAAKQPSAINDEPAELAAERSPI